MWISALLLFVSHLLGCSSPERSAQDRNRLPAAKGAASEGAGGPGNAAWPDTGLAEFVFTHLDLASFRNSTGGQRSVGDRFFADIGVHPTQTSGTVATHEKEEDGSYTVRVLARRDFNGDGLEEVAVCFIDQARNGGTYNTQAPLLLQLVDGRAIALSFEIDGMAEAETCPHRQ